MAVTKLGVYREALRLIGEHDIASTSVDEEPRYVLDAAYDNGVLYCLSLGWWRFAFHTEAAATTASGSPGFSYRISFPNNWLRTHSVGVLNGTRFLPTDWHEFTSSSYIYVKYATIYINYISKETSETLWPEVFGKLVAAYLAFECCERISQSRATKADLAKIFEERLSAARVSESLPPPLVLPQHAVERTTLALLEQGFWRFSVVTGTPSGTTSPAAGYAYAFTLPADYVRVYDVTVESSGKLRPVDWRIEGLKLSAKASSVRLQYVSNTYADPTRWTQGFADAVMMALELESAAASGAPADKIEPMRVQLDKAIDASLAKDGLPRPHNLPEHAVERSARSLLEQGFWRFSVKTAAPSGTTGPAAGYASAYTLPADHLRTYDVSVLANARLYPIDRQEEGGKLSTQFAANVRLRYVSSDFLVPSTWPEAFAEAVDVCLSIEALRAVDPAADVKVPKGQLDKMLDGALGKDRLPRPLLLPPGAVDRVVRSQLEDGIWRFGSETVSLASIVGADLTPGYSFAFSIPSDLARIIRVFRMDGSTERDIDYRYDRYNEEETVPDGLVSARLYANYDPIKVRYVSRDAVNPLYWTELFAMAFDAGLRYESAMAENLPEGEVRARMATWRALLKEAKIKDGLNERPKIYTGSWNRSRGGYLNREQAR